MNKPAERIILNTDVSQIQQLIDQLIQAGDSRFIEEFAKRFKPLSDANNLIRCGACVERSNVTTGAREFLVPLYPSDALLCLSAALLTGQGNFEIFDHEFSISSGSMRAT